MKTIVVLLLPAILATTEAVSYYVHHRNNGFLVSSGHEREYTLYVPKTYDHTKPTALVISMHGAGGWPVMQQDVSEWNETADAHGFIVAYPSGLKRRVRVWEANLRGRTDVTFIADLIDTLKATYNIDPARIYANGLSNGAGMSFVLSCALSDRIAAVGLVAAAHLERFDACTDERPVPMIAFHGTADRMTPYYGGRTWVAPRSFPNIPMWTADWARRNRCVPEPIDAVVTAEVTRRSYAGCAEQADVVLYTIDGGGHTWPGGGPLPEWFVGATTASIDASKEMWAFFREHPLTRR